jgi:uncharacterized phiE125 gp8 family phage protein
MHRYILGTPLVEPLLLMEVKRWLRVDHSDDDPLITGLIKAARERIEARTGRALLAQSWRIVMDRWPQGGRVALPIMPVISIMAIRVATGTGLFTIVAPAGYSLEARLDPPEVLFSQVPEPVQSRNGIEIDIVAGYGTTPGDCPESLRQAMLLLIGEAYLRRGPDQSGDDRIPVGSDVEQLLSPYRSLRLGRIALEKSAFEQSGTGISG